MNSKKVINVSYIFILLFLSVVLWIKGLDKILQAISILLCFVFLTIPYVFYNKKNVSGYLLTLFFASAIFITTYAINSLMNYKSKNLENDIKIYGLVSGSFFWSSVIIFVIYNSIKNKKDMQMWKKDLIMQGKIALRCLINIFLLITFWVILAYAWKGIDKININIISKVIMILISWFSLSILTFTSQSFLKIKTSKLS